jgi:acyl carrier protein
MELEVIILDLPISQIVLTRIKESIENEIIDQIVLEDDLSSIGVNSITFIKIVVDLETEFDFEFDDEMLSYKSFPTTNSLVEYIDSKLSRIT